MSKPLLPIACPHCRFRFQVDRQYAGRMARCPRAECGERFRIPELPDGDEPDSNSGPQPAGDVPDRADSRPRRTASSQAKPGDTDRNQRADKETEARYRSGRALARERVERAKHGRESGSSRRRIGVAGLVGRLRHAASVAGLRTWSLGIGGCAMLLAGLMFALAPGGRDGSGSALSDPALAAEGPAGPVTAATGKPPQPDLFASKLQPFVTKFCLDCHSSDDPQAGIDFTKFASSESMLKGDGRKIWEQVHGMLDIGAMPPPDAPQPSEADRKELAAWLHDKLFNLDCEHINDPGRVTVRRLNRAEYNNTIRDLLGVTFQPAADFPSDDVGYGFDNIGDVLSLSPLLMEKYLDAAEAIAIEALPVSDSSSRRRFGLKELELQGSFDRQDGFFALNSAGEVFLRLDVTRPGEHSFFIRCKANQLGPELVKIDMLVDHKKVASFDVRGEKKAEVYETKLPLTAGKHRIAARFVNDLWIPGKGDRNAFIGDWELVEPVDQAKLDRLVPVRPGEALSVRDAAKRCLEPLVRRAFRRPPVEAEVDRLAGLVGSAVNDGEVFERGLQYALQAVLVSPQFLFRVEADAQPDNAFADRPVTDFELASRLSYFLWSSMPDQELFDLAGRGELRKPDVLTAQTRRMLRDAKAAALSDNFAEQWLNLRSLEEVTPDPQKFPDFDPELRAAMQRESLELFAAVLKEDRSVLDFLGADFTFINGRLARHYGIRNVTGSEFRRVPVNPNQRAGLLTHASILTLTSNPDRTSPVKRGKWIMENILGTAPPPPPPNVPELEKTQAARPDATLREQLQQHRADPGCASCHTTMDTLGFGFENFDAVGVWRERDGTHPVDASGTLPSGEAFSSPVELVRILKGRSRQFCRCLSEKMLTYALGRGLEYYDRCAIDEILKRLENNQHKASELVLSIVHSRPFLTRRGDGQRE